MSIARFNTVETPSIEATIGEGNLAFIESVSIILGVNLNSERLGHNNVVFLERVSLYQGLLLRGVPLYIPHSDCVLVFLNFSVLN